MSGRDLYYRLNPTAHPNAWNAHDPDVRARYDAEALRSTVEADEDPSERHYIAGSRAAWRSILSLACRELEGPDLKLAGALAQLHDVRAALQSACEGRVEIDDWNLHLADVVSKYLVPYIAEREGVEGYDDDGGIAADEGERCADMLAATIKGWSNAIGEGLLYQQLRALESAMRDGTEMP